MKQSHVLILGAAIGLSLAGCKNQSDPAAEASTAKPEAAAPAPASAPAPAPRPDVLKPDQVAITIELESPAKLTADGRSLEVPVKIVNNGTAAISSELQPAVNVGVQILADDGTLTSPGAARDFSRTKLPLIEPGASASVVVNVPVSAKIDGRKLSIGLVQESVAWFSSYGQPTLAIGPFKLCEDKVCDMEGKQL